MLTLQFVLSNNHGGVTLVLLLLLLHVHFDATAFRPSLHAHADNHDGFPMPIRQNSSVFRMYISGDNVQLTDVPFKDDLEVHLILAFVIDYDQNGNPANGKFQPYWNNRLTPRMVKEVKQEHQNVKVMMSLGGDSFKNQNVVFTPNDQTSWVNNAVSSLSDLGKKYHLDGIDIDYEHFVDGQDVAVFANCMGAVIRKLKEKGQMTIASIAPFDEVQSHYKALWDGHGDHIDYVNFQFYAYDADTSTKQLLALYHKAAALYDGGRILTGFSTDLPEGGGNFAPRHIFDASSSLIQEGSLPGMFSWVADTSAPSKFQYERKAEALLDHH